MVYAHISSRRIGRAVPITVLMADDKEVVLSSIRLLLGSDPEVRIVGEAASFRETVQRATDLKPQVVVMDLHMLGESSVSPQEIKSLLDTLGSRLISASIRTANICDILLKMFCRKLSKASSLPPQSRQTCRSHRTANIKYKRLDKFQFVFVPIGLPNQRLCQYYEASHHQHTSEEN